MGQLIENGRLVLRLLQDSRVPSWIKVGIPVFVIIYFISPIDLIPDFIPGLGQLDDLGIILLGLTLIVRLSPQDVVNEHRTALGYPVQGGSGSSGGQSSPGTESQGSASEGGTIEGDYRV